MKQIFASILLVASVGANAHDPYFSRSDVAYVVNVVPKMQTTFQRQCNRERFHSDNSTLGTVIGGVTGGIIGNQVGNGSGRDVATALGVVIGAGVGNRIGHDQRNEEYREVCREVPVTVQRGETVTFEYKGRRFTMSFD